MNLIIRVALTALEIYSLLILGRILLSWVPLRSGTVSYKLYSVLYDVTEPYLRVFRRYLPPVRFGNAALDLSPVVGLAVLFIVQSLVARL
jgi:YggT family protein